MAVVIETTLGDVTVDLYTKERPNTCMNFLKLCKIKYYNYCLIHSVQRNFVIQTGDPTGLSLLQSDNGLQIVLKHGRKNVILGTGRGGESVFLGLYGDQAKYFDGEFEPKIKHRNAGTLSMINNGNGQFGSQFLLTTGENLDYLDGQHCVFGEVAEGLEVLMKINETFCDANNRPFQDIRITHTVILDDPYDDPKGLKVPDRSPELTEEQLQDPLRIAAHEKIDDYEGMTVEERREIEESKEASHKAQVLEMIGDLPDKDVKPPDHVLFVCKLNAVTTDEDLEIIFSRFGQINSCEIIRDRKTGDSLQYAFIEFNTPEECEKAYLKMDNVLIDDRRIHVDFSQSVSKLQFPRQADTKPPKEDKNEMKRERENNKRESIREHKNGRRERKEEKSRRSSEEREREVRCGKHRKHDYVKRDRTDSRHKTYERTNDRSRYEDHRSRHTEHKYKSDRNKHENSERKRSKYSRSPSPNQHTQHREESQKKHKKSEKLTKSSHKTRSRSNENSDYDSRRHKETKQHKNSKKKNKRRRNSSSDSST